MQCTLKKAPMHVIIGCQGFVVFSYADGMALLDELLHILRLGLVKVNSV